SALELWAGPECTVTRVGDVFRDQLELTGFAHRPEDLDRLAGLGIKRLRFPALWERTAPDKAGAYDWRWCDERLARLKTLGVSPILGLTHHGSGPHYTDLLDPGYPEKLAEYARAVAERYPEIAAYTPVNEPVTTARFSALYGFWYPHRRDDVSFVRAVLNQMRATVLAMREIRRVNPDAQLVQTEDLGYTHSTPSLAEQADFNNARRWLSFDLLAGKVGPGHRLWEYLRESGASAEELIAFVEAPCPPDIVGINYYVTSERFLDDRLWLHRPSEEAVREGYVDIETVRVHGQPIGGFEARLREASHRYGLPVAITEVHLNCSRDEQIRWFYQAWRAANTLRDEGADIRAVTAWAAFGAMDWDSLCTRNTGSYEAGLWDVTASPPRPTALATLARQLAHGETPGHPALMGPGWWQRSLRLCFEPHGEVEAVPLAGRPVLITGATGTLGRAFARLCEMRGLPHHLLNRAELDIADADSVNRALERWQPWAVINTAGFVRVDDAEREARQWRENAVGPAVLAEACARQGVRLVSFSSDLVFDGTKAHPYVESDTPQPLNAYGRAKLAAERAVLALAPDALVIRTSAFFGPWDEHNFIAQGLAAVRRGEAWRAPADQFVSPTYVPDLVQAALDLLIDAECGLWHIANRGAVSWAEFARMALEIADLDVSLIDAVPGARLGQVACRPRFSVLESERGMPMPRLEESLACYLAEVAPRAA
ncbi:MAG: family 1 glycosylhydrolase, partial [Betaproteobacteria bacterium]